MKWQENKQTGKQIKWSCNTNVLVLIKRKDRGLKFVVK